MTAGIDVPEDRPAADRLDLLGREGQPEQVADRLLEPREDQVGPVLRASSRTNSSNVALSAGHPRGEVAGHHRQLVEVGDRAQRVGVGPERDGRFGVHRVPWPFRAE